MSNAPKAINRLLCLSLPRRISIIPITITASQPINVINEAPML